MDKNLVSCKTCKGTGRRVRRTYLARWLDEDRGWRADRVVALSEEHARDLVEELYPSAVSVQVRPL